MTKINKVLIVHPHDSTTDFLSEIVDHLSDFIEKGIVTIFRITPDDKSHETCINAITNSDYSLIIFLGHGSSIALHGAKNQSYNCDNFINPKNFHCFDDRQLILLSCNSTSFLKRHFEKKSISSAVGFGDLPTDFIDVASARELDINAYKGLNEGNIEVFRMHLVDIFKFSLQDYLSGEFPLRYFIDLIKIRINKRLYKISLEKNLDNLAAAYLLYDVKNELSFWGNPMI